MTGELLAKLIIAELRPVIDAAVAPFKARVAELDAQVRSLTEAPPAVSVVSGTIDRSGHLILGQSNGTTLDVGEIVGKDFDPAHMELAIARAIAAVPVEATVKEVDPESVRTMVRDAVDALAPTVASQVEKAVAALPVPEAPAGIAAAVINQAGHLILTMDDGVTRDVGEVVGQSVDVDAVHRLVHRMFSELPTPKDGRDGIATRDELLVLVREAVELAVAPQVEAQVAKAIAEVPRMEYKDVWVEGPTYGLGDAVTFGGNIWVCRAAGTTDKPGTSAAWRLAVKKGRDGKGA